MLKIQTDLDASLANIQADREKIGAQLAQITALTNEIEALKALREQLEIRLRSLISQVAEKDEEIITEKKLSETAQARVALLNQQIKALRVHISKIAKPSRSRNGLLNNKKSKLRFGFPPECCVGKQKFRNCPLPIRVLWPVRDVLGNQPGIQIVGDRFVFQSEVLFSKGSDRLGTAGRIQIEQLAGTLKAITSKIPENIDWILRVDGHTDQVPIRTSRFPSNWELSTARAISVVKSLIEQGIRSENLAATGFGEYQPIDLGDTEQAYRRNRRIELKLTQR